MAFAFSKIAVTLTCVAGPGVLVGAFAVTVRLRLNDWKDITTDLAQVNNNLPYYLLYSDLVCKVTTENIFHD